MFLRFIIAVIAVVKKVSGIATENYLQQQAQRADKQAFQRLLAKIPNREDVMMGFATTHYELRA
ncbi:MAG: hypothetical protein ACXV8P_10265 [Methylobacter sp.]